MRNMAREYMTELPLGIDCSAVSQLQPADDMHELSSETLLLVSQPTYESNLCAETSTGYISMYATLDSLVDYIREQLVDGELKTDSAEPYVITSYKFKSGQLVEANGYPLKDALDKIVLAGYEAISEDAKCIQANDTIATALHKLEERLIAIENKQAAVRSTYTKPFASSRAFVNIQGERT